MQQAPMRQVVRAKIALSQEIAERLHEAGVHLRARPPRSAEKLPQDSFIAEVDAASEIQAIQAMRRALEPWGDVPLEPLGRRGKVLIPRSQRPRR